MNWRMKGWDVLETPELTTYSRLRFSISGKMRLQIVNAQAVTHNLLAAEEIVHDVPGFGTVKLPSQRIALAPNVSYQRSQMDLFNPYFCLYNLYNSRFGKNDENGVPLF